jgi:hypothetical protein
MRERLSWDKEKTAEIMKQADPYTMNQTRSNPPVEKYRTGDPSTWAEDQNKATPWKTEGRTETGHPAPAREAVVQARKLEDKALKCITIAQRMLPGADESVVEDQATDFMFLPERSIQATLQRQTELATKIAAECKEDDEKDEEKKEEVPVEAKKDEKDEEKKEEVPVEAKKEEKDEEKKEEVPVEAKKEASDKDLLDVLFDSAEIVPQTKTGAKTLSGLVKQASNGSDPLAGLWETPPDISSVFGRNR